MLSKVRIAILGKLAVLATLGLGYCTMGCHGDHDEGEGRHAGYRDRGDYYNNDHYSDHEHQRYDDRFH